MNALAEVFKNRHVILPVIHVEYESQAVANASVARAAGADGVFLINHGGSHEYLLKCHHKVRQELPGWWIGINSLALWPEDVFASVSNDIDGIWTDNAGVDEAKEDQPEAERIWKARQSAGWHGLYFGGVAFKYQRRVKDLASAARIASAYMDVVTTSGPGTGQAADRAKIKAMKEALGELPLAIASGITPENVDDYLDIADCFLVATGISRDFTTLDPARIKHLIDRVRECQE